MQLNFLSAAKMRVFGVVSGLALVMAACTPAPIRSDFADPVEPQNRAVHKFNLGLDRALVRPAANTYGSVVPGPIRTGVRNFASNLSLPGTVINDLLQFRLEDAGTNTFRFLLNTTFGFAGLLDVAVDAGIDERSTDFGETLHVWGIGEGAYLELPIVGPSTARHTVGRVVDTVANPLNFVLKGSDRAAATGSSVIARFGDRYQYSDFVDSILYESEDSYAQARLLYLQNRRFQLTGEEEPEYFDPYEDIYGPE